MRSMAIVLFVFAALLAAPALVAQDPAGGAPKAGVLAVVGVSVMAPDADEPFSSHVPGQAPGTSVVLLWSDPARCILGLEEESLKIATFSDDKGTDLAGEARLGPWPRVGEKKDRVAFSVVSERVPAAGAREIRLKASIAVLTGADLKTATQEGLALAKGAAVSAGGLVATIAEVTADDSADAPSRTVEFTSGKGFAAIQSIEFLTPEGTPIEASEYGSSTMNDGEKIVYGKTWNLAGKVDKVTLRVTYFEKVESVPVEIDVSAGVGL